MTTGPRTSAPAGDPDSTAFVSSDPVFVGRERELDNLEATLAAAVRGSGRVVLLGGEAGIGKTSTCQEFAARAGAAGATVLWGRCFEGDWAPPYAPWVEALDDFARGLPPETLRAVLDLGAPPLATMLPAIQAALPDTPPPASLAPE